MGLSSFELSLVSIIFLLLIGAVTLAFYMTWGSKPAANNDIFEDKDETKKSFAAEDFAKVAEKDVDIVSIRGKTDLYEWCQSEKEVDVYFKIAADVKSKDIQVSFKPNSLRFKVRGETIKEGEIFREIDSEDCNWQFDDLNGERVVWVTLTKRNPSKGNQHWKTVFKGDPEVDMSKFGVPVHTIDPSMSRDQIKKAVSEVKSYTK